MIAEVREWLTKIDTTQNHMLELLKKIESNADDAKDKADRAMERANDAFDLAERAETEFYKHKKQEYNNRRFIIGTVISVAALIISVVPILITFYGN
ncbi:hypothetical protein JCM19038_2829 [Geomicrobium sp. JCM 19038]|nr:hypothetical protein JCM19038_2829 [Geomicrobium sp. JCM 19038]